MLLIFLNEKSFKFVSNFFSTVWKLKSKNWESSLLVSQVSTQVTLAFLQYERINKEDNPSNEPISR